jgi:acyl-CoA thioesterase I
MLLVQLGSLAGCSGEQAPAAPERTPSGGTEIAAPEPPRADTKLVLAFGDSLYAGYGLPANAAFPAVLERELAAQGIAARVVNAGVSGDTTAAGLQRLAFTLDGLERNPDLAIVGLGANDVLRGIPPAEARRNLQAILDELKRRGIKVMLTGMLAPRNYGSEYVAEFERIYPELAEQYDAELDPFFLEGVITDRRLLLPDGLHPNAQGIERIARRLAPAIGAQLKAPEPDKAA